MDPVYWSHTRFAKANLTVETRLASPPPLVFGHSHQIRQMLLNLLFNADEAMALVEPPRGGHRISVETLVHSDDGQDEVTIIISDTGGGIAPADMTRIFDPSYTTKIENGKVRGLGMGLYVSYGLAQAHGGTIDVESLLGQGSRFIICLPAEAKEEGATATDE